MIQRNSSSSREVNLPLTTNDANPNLIQTKRPAKTRKHRHRPPSKSLLLVRAIGAVLLLFVIFLYIAGTRHVLSISSPGSSSARANINDVLYQQSPETRSERAESSSHKPRTIGYYFDRAGSDSFVGIERIDVKMETLYDNSITRIYRQTTMTKEDMKYQEMLLDSKSYDHAKAEKIADQAHDEDCVPQYDWQEHYSPSCNHLMEVDLTNLNYMPMFHEDHYNNRHDDPLASSPLHSYSKLIAGGGWRDVWRVENFLRHGKGKQEETFILKTMLYEHDYTARNYDRHRRDAVAMAQLSSSEFIMNIYGFCGNSGLFEYADGGDLEQSINYNYYPKEDSNDKPWTPEEKMVVAYQASSGLADLHNFAKDGVPAVAHSDIAADQFVFVVEDGVYKLNDFNRARFLGIHNKTKELCGFYIGNNPGIYRSPEEYAYVEETEKIDVYSLGNILYQLLTGKELFYNAVSRKRKALTTKIKAGERSIIPPEIMDTTDPFENTLLQGIEMCWRQDPKKRATAREVQTLFMNELEKQGVDKKDW